jgi:MYXO-CTERM domain-containing protein
MTRSVKLGLAFAFATSWLAPPAHADIPPPDTCDEVGEACLNAGPAFDEPGTCFTRTCTKGPPGQQVTYECLRCEVKGEGGSGGAGGDAATGGTATGGKANAGSPSTPPKSDGESDDGCSVRGVGAERGFAGLMLLLGLALLGRGRRR